MVGLVRGEQMKTKKFLDVHLAIGKKQEMKML
jgi:hypothetical protein